MKAKRGTSPTATTQKGAPWQWREGRVNNNLEHFELRYGKASAEWDAWTLVAIVGRKREGLIDVQFLVDKAHPRTSKMVEDTVTELNFYIVELHKEDPWQYLQYHCTTTADVYSSVHWSFLRATAKTGQPEREKH